MKRVFVDSNVFLRFFTQDDAGQCQEVAKLFRDAASNKLGLITGPPVLFEIAWTLRAAYRQPREKVLEVISAICALPGLHVTDGECVEAAVQAAWRSGQEFADAYISVSAEAAGAEAVATFNHAHFKKLGAHLYWTKPS